MLWILQPLLTFLRFSGSGFSCFGHYFCSMSWFPPETLPFLLIEIGRFWTRNEMFAKAIKKTKETVITYARSRQKHKNSRHREMLIFLVVFRGFWRQFSAKPLKTQFGLCFLSKNGRTNHGISKEYKIHDSGPSLFPRKHLRILHVSRKSTPSDFSTPLHVS